MDKQFEPGLYQFFAESLSTHTSLKNDNIHWAAGVMNEIGVDFEHKVTIGLLANKRTFAGRHATMFNLTIDNIIQNQSTERMRKLMSMKFDLLYPELNDNKLLSSDERKTAKALIDGEYQATIITLQTHKRSDRCHLMPYVATRLPSTIGGLHETVGFVGHYDLVCAKKDVYASGMVNGQLSAVDSEGNRYSFLKDIILARFAVGNFTHPNTGSVLPKEIVESIERQFAIEIKMLRRPLDFRHGDIPIINAGGNITQTYTPPAIPMPVPISTPRDAGSPLATLSDGKITKPTIASKIIETPLPEIPPFRGSPTLPVPNIPPFQGSPQVTPLEMDDLAKLTPVVSDVPDTVPEPPMSVPAPIVSSPLPLMLSLPMKSPLPTLQSPLDLRSDESRPPISPAVVQSPTPPPITIQNPKITHVNSPVPPLQLTSNSDGIRSYAPNGFASPIPPIVFPMVSPIALEPPPPIPVESITALPLPTAISYPELAPSSAFQSSMVSSPRPPAIATNIMSPRPPVSLPPPKTPLPVIPAFQPSSSARQSLSQMMALKEKNDAVVAAAQAVVAPTPTKRGRPRKNPLP